MALGKLRLSPFFIALVMLAAMAQAETTLAKRTIESVAGGFLPAQEAVDEVIPFSSGGKPYYLVAGSNSSLILLSSEFLPVADEAVIASIAPDVRNLSVSSQRAASLYASFQNFSDDAFSCRVAYDEFRSGKHVCFDYSGKFQCSYLYDQNFWKGILAFDIVPVKNDLESSLPLLALRTDRLGSLLLEVNSTSPPIAGLNLTISSLHDAFARFINAHAQMISYPPFFKDGGLSKCRLTLANFSLLERRVNNVLLMKGPEVEKAMVDSSVRASGEQAVSLVLYNTARDALDKYVAQYGGFKARFQAINGISPTFALRDQSELQNQIAQIKTARNDTDARLQKKAFDAYLANATARVVNAEAALAAYKRAAVAINQTAHAVAAAEGNYGGEDLGMQDVRRKLVDLQLSFAIKELAFKTTANLSEADFDKIAQEAKAAGNFTALAAPAKTSIPGLPFGFSFDPMVAAIAVSIAAILVVIYLRLRKEGRAGGCKSHRFRSAAGKWAAGPTGASRGSKALPQNKLPN
ncbi:hypothetical protein HY095_04625 [Candidatus Micrarchaeota archaeon]|nr:hypothetical protein [Candidatus Micrarchaeota archaeon]